MSMDVVRVRNAFSCMAKEFEDQHEKYLKANNKNPKHVIMDNRSFSMFSTANGRWVKSNGKIHLECMTGKNNSILGYKIFISHNVGKNEFVFGR